MAILKNVLSKSLGHAAMRLLAIFSLAIIQLFFVGVANAQQIGSDFDHSATGFLLDIRHQDVRCETCHIKGQFKGTPRDCASCHAWTNPRATTIKSAKHIPVDPSLSCETCHSAFLAQFSDAKFSHVTVAPGTSCEKCHNGVFPSAPASPGDSVHKTAKASGLACSACHSTITFSKAMFPSNHIPVATTSKCTSCHVTGDFAVMPTISSIHANAPSSSSNCQQCHSAANAAAFATPSMMPALVGPPVNHVGMVGLGCESCHVGAGSSLNLPVQDTAKFSNSKFNHGSTTSGCVTCHGPNVNAGTFFGLSAVVVMPPSTAPGLLSHLPTSTRCESCHSGSLANVVGQIPSAASLLMGPGTKFQMPAPTSAMIHAGVTGNCSACHDTNNVWMGVSQYPLNGYLGFQSRPQPSAGQFNVADLSHPMTGECSDCHTGIAFDPSLVKRPANHIPVASSSTCVSCHTGSDFSVMPTVTAIHANIPSASTNCQQCHSVANAAIYDMPTMVPSIKAPPSNHIPMGSLGCESCHVAANSSLNLPVQTGANFSNSAFNHNGIAANCANCHGPNVVAGTFFGILPKTISSLAPGHLPVSSAIACETCHVNSVPTTLIPMAGASGSMTNFSGAKFTHTGITSGCETCHGPNVNGGTFYGETNIVVMPTTSGPSAMAHIPSNSTCENCHVGSVPSGLIAGLATKTAPGTGFQIPAPTSAMIHVGMIDGCSSCHETNDVWMGMSKYPITTSAPFRGFQTRPQNSSGTFFVADSVHPTTGDCSQCHGSFVDFTSPSMPVGHIPVAASSTCGTCHKSNDFSVMPSITDIHANALSTSANCAQCHSASNAALYARPTMVPALVAPPANHIAMGSLGCESCHVGAGSSIVATPVQNGSKFANSLFSHSGISSGCDSCHGANVYPSTFAGVYPKTISSLSPIHVPTTAACETCHINSIPAMLVPSAGMTTFSGAQFSHKGITSGCDTCHGPNLNGSSFYGVTSIVVMPPLGGAGSGSHVPASTTCESCHLGSTPTGLVPGVATKTAPGSAFMTPAPTASMIHAGVTTGACSTCHETNMTWMSMNQYPITTAAPFKGFQTRPQTTSGQFFVADGAHPVAGDCSNCHGNFVDFTSPSKPANHIPVAASSSCTSCHTNVDYSVMPTITNIHANAPSSSVNCAQCHSTANAALYASPTMIPAIVTPPVAHIAMGSLGCESCHVGANSSMNLPVRTGANFGNSAFSHVGITSGCATCHGSSVTVGTFYGVMPKTISSLNPIHVPVQASSSCETCHVSSIPSTLVPSTGATSGTTFAGAKFSHTGITSGCDTCHGPTVNGSTFYGVTNIVVMPPTGAPGSGSHIPASTACESCHMGSTPSALVPGVATVNAPGSAFMKPAPTSAMIHAGISGGCASCHDSNNVWMSMGQYPITTVAPFKGFQTRPQMSFGQFFVADPIHPSGECSNCHAGFVNFNGPAMTSNHIPVASGSACASCHGNFSTLPSVSQIHANIQSTSTNCVQCHSVANAATYSQGIHNPIVAPPAAHIGMASLSCEACHVGANSSMTSTPVQDGAKFTGSLFVHTGITTGCDSCHGPAVTAATFTGVYPKTISSLSPSHVPTTAACETCHTNNIPSGLVPAAGMTTFAGAKFSHTAITSGCVTCHGPAVTSSTFFGVQTIVMPQSAVPGSSHMPASTTCESCHIGSKPTVLVPPVATATVPGSAFRLPAPTSSMIHSGVTGGCSTCHETGSNWVSMTQYPITTSAPYRGFQTRPQSTSGQFFVADGAHPTAGDCSNCHASFVDFTAAAMPANHIPIKTGAVCASCHTSSDYSVMPALDVIHANAPSSSTNCAQCHSTTNAATYAMATMVPAIVVPPTNHIDMGSLGCESCHVGANSSLNLPVQIGAHFTNSAFSHTGITTNCSNCHGVNVSSGTFAGPTPKTVSSLTPSHIPVNNNVGCETCHVSSIPAGLVPATGATGGTTFAGAKFSHSLITKDCATCHGPTVTSSTFYGINNIVVMPAVSPAGISSHLPTSTVCEACHAGSMPAGLVAGNATNTAANSTFLMPAPTATMIHAGITGSCSTCHDTNMVWMGVSKYPITTVAPFTGFQTRPQLAAGTFFVKDALHPTAGDCSNCHGGFTNFNGPSMPANHIPVAATATCGACHGSFTAAPTIGKIHANIQSTSTNCAQCHSTANAALYAATTTINPIKAIPSTHVPFGTTACETCHVGAASSMTSTPVLDGAKFSGSAYSHSGVTSGCVTCHGQGINGSSFFGITNIVVMPPSTTSGVGSHLPTSTTCESCHIGSTPKVQVPANATKSAPGSAFLLPVPTATMIHAGVTGSCNTCHDTAKVWMSVDQYPITRTSPYTGFQTRPVSGAGTFNVDDALHPSTGDCSSCHVGFVSFATTVKPANHIPYATTAACTSCHLTGTSYTAMPSLTAIHANAQSTSTNCAQCHSVANAALYPMTPSIKAPSATHIPMGTLGCESCHISTQSNVHIPVINGALFSKSAFSHTGINTGCATCHGGFSGNIAFDGVTPKGLTGLAPAHVPNPSNLDCGVCHTAIPSALVELSGGTVGNTFSGAKFSHTGITTSCGTCHGSGITGASFYGVTAIVVLPATTAPNGHIPAPTNAQCEVCHLPNTPAALVPGIAATTTLGSTMFKTPVATGAMIHTGITTGCNSCHEAGNSWLGVNLYARSPTTYVAGATYVGFQTRPKAGGAGYSVVDPSHPTTGDCSQCHGNTVDFSVSAKPSNHIPVSTTSTCVSCHTNLTTTLDFSVMPTITNIHAYAPSTTTNCAQCHSAANAAIYANPTVGFAIKSPASIAKHVPYGTVACEVCHVYTSAVVTGNTFAGGKFSHTGITTGCASCHGGGLAATNFTGISNLVAIPATAAMGSTSHIPYTAACEACHVGSTPAGLYAVTGTPAAVTGFKAPIPTTTVIHANSTGTCMSCHDRGYLWKSMDQYPRSPLTISGLTTTQYTGFQTRPGATATTYGFTDVNHTGSTLDTGDCSLCHSGVNYWTAEGKPAGHMPTTVTTCSTCHAVAGDYSVAGLGTLTSLHTGVTSGAIVAATTANMITKTCGTCHTVGTGGTSGTAPFAGCATQAACSSPPPIAYQPSTTGLHPLHVPIGTTAALTVDCNGCHAAVTAFSGVNMKNSTMHTSVNGTAKVKCMSCHETGMAWYGVANLKVRPTPTGTGGLTPHSGSRAAPNDCNNSGCHSFNGGFRAIAKPVMRLAIVNPLGSRLTPNLPGAKPSRGTLGNNFDHKGVEAGKCKTCHDGKSASGMSARHLMVATSCDTCHRTSAWTPAVFTHNGITPNTCMICHNGVSASAKPSGHFMTTRSCDSCHKTEMWKPVMYSHMSPNFKPSNDMLTCVSCHTTNSEIIPRQMRGLNRVKPIQAGP